MPASLDDVRLKIKRAKEHVYALEANWRAFLKTNPYTVVPKDNPESGHREFVVTRAKRLPKRMALIAGDSIHNLRSALDQLVWQLIVANGGDPETYRSEFPIGKSKPAYNSIRKTKTEGISNTALDLIDAFEPYKEGNEALWLLHYLDIVDKHRLLLTVAAAQKGPVLGFAELFPDVDPDGQPTPEMNIMINAVKPNPMVVGQGLFACGLGDKRYDKIKFPTFIALEEPTIGELRPLGDTLEELVDTVEAIVLKLGTQIPESGIYHPARGIDGDELRGSKVGP